MKWGLDVGSDAQNRMYTDWEGPKWVCPSPWGVRVGGGGVKEKGRGWQIAAVRAVNVQPNVQPRQFFFLPLKGTRFQCFHRFGHFFPLMTTPAINS